MSFLVEARDLSYGTPDRRVLAENLGFRLNPGQLLYITGPNGAGKSTFLKVLLGLVKPLSGTIDRRVKRIAIIPQVQNNHFHIPMTLRDVILIGTGRQVKDSDICKFELLEPRHLNLAWNTASGGERKRALLTRALLQQPEFLALDEPMNHLDATSRGLIERGIVDFVSKHRAGVAMVSHQEIDQSVLDVVRVAVGSVQPI